MLTLLKTYIDIIALRRGPEIVPSSWVVLLMSVVMMAVASYSVTVLVAAGQERNFLLTLFAYGMGLAFYAAVILLAGRPGRVLVALSCIIGCGSLITLLFVAEWVLMSPLLGREVAGLLATLIILWSVPVEGHIVARTIEQRWAVGIAVALVALVMQYGIESMLGAQA